jgi:hypothetical protein
MGGRMMMLLMTERSSSAAVVAAPGGSVDGGGGGGADDCGTGRRAQQQVSMRYGIGGHCDSLSRRWSRVGLESRLQNPLLT